MPMPISQAGTIRAFPNLARAVDVGLAARAGVRLWRSGVASLTTLGRARLSGRRTPRDRAEALARLAGELLDIHGVEVDPIGVLPTGPCLLVANQASPIDPLVVMSQIPAVPVMRAETAMPEVLAALRAGVPVLTFPDGGDHSGFELAILAGLPVVPIALATTPREPGGLWQVARRARTRVTMIVRAPMHGRPGEAPETFARRVRDQNWK